MGRHPERVVEDGERRGLSVVNGTNPVGFGGKLQAPHELPGGRHARVDAGELTARDHMLAVGDRGRVHRPRRRTRGLEVVGVGGGVCASQATSPRSSEKPISRSPAPSPQDNTASEPNTTGEEEIQPTPGTS